MNLTSNVISLFKCAKPQLNELRDVTKGYDTDVINRLISLNNNAQVELDKDTELLVAWSKDVLQAVKDEPLR